MSFIDRERSLAQGQPVRLYRFSRGVLRWLYNSSDRDITVGTEIYRALQGGVIDDGLRQTGESEQDSFEITAPATIEVAQAFRSGAWPSSDITLVVYDMHHGDSDLCHRLSATVKNVNWSTIDSCVISCTDVGSDLERPGLADTFIRACTTILGSTRCGVAIDQYRVDTQIQGIEGWTLSSDALGHYDDGWFTAGWVEWGIGSGEYERRHIEQHSGISIQLLGGVAGLSLGQEIRVFPGCDFLATTCRDKFNNLINHRGFPDMDGKSPFDGTKVF